MSSQTQRLQEIFTKWESNNFKLIGCKEFKSKFAITLIQTSNTPTQFNVIALSLQRLLRDSLQHPDHENWDQFHWDHLDVTQKNNNWTKLDDNAGKYKEEYRVTYGNRNYYVSMGYGAIMMRDKDKKECKEKKGFVVQVPLAIKEGVTEV